MIGQSYLLPSPASLLLIKVFWKLERFLCFETLLRIAQVCGNRKVSVFQLGDVFRFCITLECSIQFLSTSWSAYSCILVLTMTWSWETVIHSNTKTKYWYKEIPTQWKNLLAGGSTNLFSSIRSKDGHCDVLITCNKVLYNYVRNILTNILTNIMIVH